MPTGISGDSVVVSASGYPAEDLMAIEMRVLSLLIQNQSGNYAIDDLARLRNDAALELGLPLPVPGN